MNRKPGRTTVPAGLLLLSFLCVAVSAFAGTDYYRHVVFDNSLTQDAYFNSWGMANGASTLELKNWHLPVETNTFLTPPNALRLQWQSQPGGGWEAEIRVDNSPQSISRISRPHSLFLVFRAAGHRCRRSPYDRSVEYFAGLAGRRIPGSIYRAFSLCAKFTGEIPAGRWVQVRIPMTEFHTGSIYPFRPEFLQNIVFHQGRADGTSHTLIIDEVRVD